MNYNHGIPSTARFNSSSSNTHQPAFFPANGLDRMQNHQHQHSQLYQPQQQHHLQQQYDHQQQQQQPPPQQQYSHIPAYANMSQLPTPQHAIHTQQNAQHPSQQQTSTQTVTQYDENDAPPAIVGHDNDYTYELHVVQGPVRARMCGFGDKDRRPITPPPCIRLIIRDRSTNKEVDYTDIDPTFYIVTVDLWSPDARNEINLVRHSATSPSISATSAASYPPQPAPPVHYPHGAPLTQVHTNMTGSSQPAQSFYHHEPHIPNHHQYASDPTVPSRSYYAGGAGSQVSYGYGASMPHGNMTLPVTMDPRASTSGMFTRNLIGSLCVSAFKLDDDQRKPGIWFILQDLSVRTEGTFRLKFSFVNVGSRQHPSQLSTESSPVLSSCFSKGFQVYSAKKFPGVIESTKLSKTFAQQGIKIPIRKDGAGRDDAGDDD